MSAVSPDETGQALVSAGIKPPLAVPRRLLRMRSDAALAERFAAGDETAFDVIYERHRPVVLAVCMGVLGTPPDAEDATQETFSALAVALRTRPPAELRPWLIRVARNASIDTTRRRRHRLLTLDGEIPEVAARPHGSGKAELAVVLDGIRELPEGQRMALLMRELGGHSYAEIAEFLATDEEAVKGLIARARVGLRTYREATELSCTAARTTIAAEPDGRRYDKTIRRHLRGCASCRGYRDALRDDAKALRAALPIQAGTVATGSLSGGMLSAAKGSLISYGLTQAATTCAASACAVGAIGGMVFVAPVHRLGLPPILPVVKHTAAKQTAAKAHHHHKLVVSHPSQPATAVSSHAGATAGDQRAATAAKPALTAAVARHRRVHVTKVVLPRLHKHHGHHHSVAGPPAADSQGNQNQGNAGATQVRSTSSAAQAPSTPAPSTQVPTTQTPPSTQAASTQAPSNPVASNPGQDQGNGNANGNRGQGNGHGNGNGNHGQSNGHGNGSWKTSTPSSAPQASQAPVASPASTPQTNPVQASQAAATQATPSDARSQGTGSDQSQGNSAHGWGNGHGRWGGQGHGGGQHGSQASPAAPATAQAPDASPATTTASTATPAGTPATTPTSTAPTTAPAATAPTTTTAATTTWGGHGHGWGNGHGTATQAAPGAPASAGTPSSATSTPAPTTTPASTNPTGSTITFTGGSNGQGHGWGHGR